MPAQPSDVGFLDLTGFGAAITGTGIFGTEVGRARLAEHFLPTFQSALDPILSQKLGVEG